MKGMCFCDAMVLALLNTKPDVRPAEAVDPGKPFKSQTRRIINPQPDCAPNGFWLEPRPTPSFQPGEVFYVKEGLVKAPIHPAAAFGSPASHQLAKYSADHKPAFTSATGLLQFLSWRWKRDFLPSRYMPREVARSFGVIRAIRRERVQGIEWKDILSEGVDPFGFDYSGNPQEIARLCAYWMHLWRRIHGKGAWERNDWVWVYEFMITSNPGVEQC